MARQVLPIVGAVVGSFFGAPQLGFAIGSIIGNAVDPQVIKGPRIGEAGLQTSAEGVYRPIVKGIGPVKGNVIDRGNRQVKTKRTRQGKGGPVTEEQRVYWTFAIRICEGPIQGVTRIWQDEKLVYDVTPESPIPEETGEFASKFRLYLGGETQLPDPDLEAYRGEGNVNSYRGSAYIVFPNYDLTDRRESIPDFRFEVIGDGELFAWDYTWTFEPAPEIGGVGNSKPAFGNGMAIYASNQGAFRTTNGIEWDHVSTVGLTSVAFWESEGIFVASDEYFPSTVLFSNGIDPWVVVFNENVPGGGQVCVAEDLGYALSVSSGSTTPYSLVITPDGLVIPVELGAGPYRVTRIIRSERLGLFIAVCDTTPPPDQRLWYSTTGLESTWVSFGNYDTHWEDVIDVESIGMLIFTGNTLSTTGDTMLLTGPDIASLVDRTPPPTAAVRHFSGATQIPSTGEIVLAPRNFFGGAADFLVTLDAINFTNYPNYLTGNFTSPQWLGAPINRIMAVSTGGVLGDGALLSNSSMETGTTLGSVVDSLHQRVYQPTSRYDVSELTDPVLGIVFSGDYTCADAVRTLMTPYFFDSSEYDGGSGYKIHYPKRGKPVVTTITIDQIIDAPEKSVRQDALERPKVIHLHYENRTVGYAPAKATARRDSTDILVVGELSFQIPVVFEDVDEPAQRAQMLQKVTWTEVAGNEEFIVHDGLLNLVPSDCIGVSLRGQVRRMRIVDEQIGQGELRWTLIADRQSAYTSNVTGIPVPAPTPPLPSIVGTTLFEFLDIPALNDTNDRLLYYVAATGESPAWYGATIQRKGPSATEYEDVASFTLGSIMGELLEVVPSASEYWPDTTNRVHLHLFREGDELESLTEAEFLSEGGSFALEKPDGTWEVMQYRDAAQDSSGDWVLSHLARGRLNSGPSEHNVGARFVLLDTVKSVDTVVAFIDNDLTHRAVSFGTSPETATEHVDEYQGVSQREFPVAHLFADLDGSTLNLTTVPRHRFGTEDNPIASINWSGYRWTATDGTNTLTADTIAPSQSFDVSGWGSPITVSVAQLNRITGAGPTVSEVV